MSDITLPPLPAPRFDGFSRGGLLIEDGYTADQMHAYARAALAAAQPPIEQASHWWALVMGAAASIEDAANCLRDPDAKRQAEGAAKHYRAAAQAMLRAAQPEPAPVAPLPAKPLISPDGVERIWECKIGSRVRDIPRGADAPMRRAVEKAFEAITGYESQFLFSGWGGELTEGERAVVENRLPAPPEPIRCKCCGGMFDDGGCMDQGRTAPQVAQELELDAARYRWLRSRNQAPEVDPEGPYVVNEDEGADCYPNGEKLDAAIDAARAPKD